MFHFFAIDSSSNQSSGGGNHLQYILDSQPPIDYYSTDPIILYGLPPEKHVIKLVLVDESGQQIIGDYTSAPVDFVVGINSLTDLKVTMLSGAVTSLAGNLTSTITLPVSVGNITVTNIYSPIEVQFIPNEISVENPTGVPTILIAKLPTPDTDKPVKSNYFDGHTVLQYDLSGKLIFSNNTALFAKDRATMKQLLGSAEKVSATELLLADTLQNRAIVVVTNPQTQASQITWEYDADRSVSDFHLIKADNVIISVGDSTVTPPALSIQFGTTVIWKNTSSSMITIYSGNTTPAQFNADPDLTLYGQEFISQQLMPGQEYAFTFNTLGTYDWFAYPSIATGQVVVGSARISSGDTYLIVENDIASVTGGRVIKVDTWGNTTWSFGDQFLYLPRDARSQPDGSVIISV